MKNVTLVITSCNRLDLLSKTIRSFEAFNTYPLKEAIIIEDSGIQSVYNTIKKEFGDRFEVIFNNPSLKQIGSVDKVYGRVETDYIFHCEDDWEFYRHGFIEDSLKILESEKTIKQVGLRSVEHDLKINHPTVGFSDKHLNISNVGCIKLAMKDQASEYDWVTFSFTPGLLRKKDYELAGTYGAIGSSEASISMFYKKKGFMSVALVNDAVKHIGWDESTMGHYTKSYNFTVRAKNLFKSFLNLFGTNYPYN
jgi:hypothetical protein